VWIWYHHTMARWRSGGAVVTSLSGPKARRSTLCPKVVQSTILLTIYVRFSAYIMSIFDDSNNLRGQSFAYGLAPFDRVATDSDEFVESDKVSVFVDEDGTVNVDETIMLYKEADPLDAIIEPNFSKDNQFIAGLNKAITAVPIGGIILFPTYNPRSVASPSKRNWLAAIFGPRYQGSTLYPRDTPRGFVPCAGQVLRYADGSSYQVADLAPPATSWGGWGGGRLSGLWGSVFSASFLPQVRYLQRVPDGWEGPDPALPRGRENAPLRDIKPDVVWRNGF
jgi:hypothetical protein